MSKAKMYGMKSAYIPNAKADARYKKKLHWEKEIKRSQKQRMVTNGENRIN